MRSSAGALLTPKNNAFRMFFNARLIVVSKKPEPDPYVT
jgi:hypothetical protein